MKSISRDVSFSYLGEVSVTPRSVKFAWLAILGTTFD